MRAKPALFKASFELTERCNLRCLHCYINQPAGDSDLRARELTTEEWRSLLKEMADAGLLWLLITGGEPLLRRDFVELYVYAKRLGLHVSVYTNGTLLTPELADLFVDYPPWKIEVTLYGASPGVYESVTGVEGSYERCTQGIELLLERGVNLGLKTVVISPNASELSAMRDMADRWGVEFRYDPMIFSRNDGSRHPTIYRLAPERIVDLESKDPSRLEVLCRLCSAPMGEPNQDLLFTCGAGAGTCHIDAYGAAYPCIGARWLRYDLLGQGLSGLLDDFLPTVRKMTIGRGNVCRQCALYNLCQPCPAWAYRETGDPEGIDPFRCELAKLRSSCFGA